MIVVFVMGLYLIMERTVCNVGSMDCRYNSRSCELRIDYLIEDE